MIEVLNYFKRKIKFGRYFRKGLKCADSQSFQDALKHFIKAHEVFDKDERVFVNIGICYIELKNYEKAIDFFKRGSKISKSNPVTYMYLGYAYYLKGNFATASEKLSISLELDNKNPLAHYYMGLTLTALGEIDKAEEEFIHVVRYDDSFLKAKLLTLSELLLFKNKSS